LAEGGDLHTVADVGGGDGGAIGLEELLDDAVERALGGKDEVDGIAAGAVTAGGRGDVLGGGFGLGTGVRGSDGEADLTHHAEIDDVVADVGDLVEGDVGLGHNVGNCGHLVVLALVDELEPEVVGADGDGAGLALGDDADTEASETGEGDAEAIVGAEALELEAVGVGSGGLGDEVELAVGEDTVDVEDEDFDFAGAVLRTHLVMIPGRVFFHVCS
jgi:hypothetical protein